MIEKMTRYTFVLMSDGVDSFLSQIEELGLVDVTRSAKPIDTKSSSLLAEAEALKNKIADIEAEKFSRDETYVRLVSEKAEAEKELALRMPWGSFDKSALDGLTEHGLKIRFYSVATKRFNPEWAEQVPLQVVKEEKGTTYFVTAGPSTGYSFPLQEMKAPGGQASDAQALLDRLDGELKERIEVLISEIDTIPALQEQYEKTIAKLEKHLAKAGKSSAAEDLVSIIEGFAPIDKDAELKTAFDAMDVYYMAEEAKLENNPPIKLRNNKFTQMFSVLTDMYGRPEYNGFDPTPYIAVFFLLFFAFCMGDAGYGLALVAVGLLLKKAKGFKDMAPLVVTLGIGTVVIGLFFHTFFSVDLLNVSWIPEGVKKCMLPSKIAGYDGTMVLAIVVGIFHLCVAMVVKTIYTTKQKGFLNSLSVWGWTLLIVGGAILGGIALTGVLSAAATKWAVIVIGVLSAAGIFLLNDIHRNPLKNIGSGLWETYNTATGLLGDVLSYLRLYALGLAGAMLGQAFNSLGGMALGDNPSIASWIFCAIIVIVGHVLNLAMCALGAFVHPLRLNFLEFFKNSGYEISGRNYNPLGKKSE